MNRLNRSNFLASLMLFLGGMLIDCPADADMPSDLKLWKTCSSDSDCVRVESACSTPDAVSKNYVEQYSAFVAKVAPNIRCFDPRCCQSLAFANATKAPAQGVHCCRSQCQFVVTADILKRLPPECFACGTTDSCETK